MVKQRPRTPPAATAKLHRSQTLPQTIAEKNSKRRDLEAAEAAAEASLRKYAPGLLEARLRPYKTADELDRRNRIVAQQKLEEQARAFVVKALGVSSHKEVRREVIDESVSRVTQILHSGSSDSVFRRLTFKALVDKRHFLQKVRKDIVGFNVDDFLKKYVPAQLKNDLPLSHGDVVVDDETTAMEGLLPKGNQHDQRPKKRDRTGYSQPGRAGKVPLACWVEPELRDAFKELAKRAGLTKEELMTYLVENVLETAQKDPSLIDQIAKNVERQEAITKRILRAASASLIKKATP